MADFRAVFEVKEKDSASSDAKSSLTIPYQSAYSGVYKKSGIAKNYSFVTLVA